MRLSSWTKAFGGLILSLSLLPGCLALERWEFSSIPMSSLVPTLAPIAAEGGAGYWPIPVSPALSDDIERLIDKHEKEGVPVLDPIENHNAPIFCMDPPSEKDIYDQLPPIPHGIPFIVEVQRNNVRMTVEKLVDQVDEPRFFPLVGPAQVHHCHFKCTVWYDETIYSAWPIPFSYTDHKQEVIYIDKDHLHRVGNPGRLTAAGR